MHNVIKRGRGKIIETLGAALHHQKGSIPYSEPAVSPYSKTTAQFYC